MLEVLEENGLCFEHLPSGIDTMSVIVNDKDFAPKREQIIDELQHQTKPDSIYVYGGICLLAVVGRGMAGAKGTASRIFNAIAAENINIRMIDQGSSELNIIIGIDEEDYVRALNAIYHEFVKN